METVWSLWSDLEQMPRWMKWIDSVQVLEDNPDLSRWKLASSGFEFSWISRILKLVPHQIIQWESVDGLPNRGAVRFYDRHGSSVVKLTVAYDIPGILGKLMDGLFLGRIVESTIQADLDRFRDYALKIQS
ncbi:Streptomyces cyclase/dehydrase superfamily [Coleofasciculus chthonoplastes PCC 7420]|uniref:Streptomyces cyclase/dehydrase superfamily n=2 Tax=Coleofasciculaceae TaxID=1892251 RepID=B4VU30_9CYAN|nr:Streptomyces cyclase/dehydrase superfamily [Coleofasciculus chthonoplastes PCC 7420]